MIFGLVTTAQTKYIDKATTNEHCEIVMEKETWDVLKEIPNNKL